MSAPVWAITAVAALGVLVRPWRLPEAVWTVAAAALLVALGAITPLGAWRAVEKGADVYLFLCGMMLLSEVARQEGLFDAVAALAVGHARGSPRRLFVLVYLIGVVITALLSNDATAVVMTPAVFAAARRAEAPPGPYLFACALVANAASFVLPISNPANLVLYGGHMPQLAIWVGRFALPSLASIGATFLALRLVERLDLRGVCAASAPSPSLRPGGWLALAGLGATLAVLLTASALSLPLGAPTAFMGVLTATILLGARQASPLPLVRHVNWSVVPLVAGLFVMVGALARTGAIDALAAALSRLTASDPSRAAWSAGGAIALAANLVNNLPAGLMASAVAARAHAPAQVTDALLIGVDLGPNASISGSLATILWLAAIRREGGNVGFLRFLKVGVVVTPPAFILAVAARLLHA